MAALKVRSFLPTTVQGSPRVDPISGLTTSVNRLGTVVEDLGKILTGMHQDKMDLLNRQQRTANFGRDRSRENRLEQDVAKGVKEDKSLKQTSKKSKGWLDAFLEPFIWIAEKAITFFMLDWLSDPKNEQFLRTTLPIIGAWLKTAWDIGTASVNMIMEAFSEDSLLMGALKLVGGIGGLWLVGRILRPWKIASDIGKLMRLVSGNKKGQKKPKQQSPQQIRAQSFKARNANASIAAKERYRKLYGEKAYQKRFGPSRLSRVKQGLGSNIRRGLKSSKVMAGGAGLISFGTRLAQGDSIQKAAGGGIGATIGSMALTALITPILGPFAPLVGSVLGGFLGDKVGAFIGEAITPILKPMKTLFMEVLLPIITSYFEPLLPPIQELFNELGPILQMIADFCKPLIDGAVKEIAQFLGGNIAKAVNGLMWLIKFGANAVSGIVEGTGAVLRKVDFLGLFKDDVLKAEERLQSAVNDVDRADRKVKLWEGIVAEKGSGHKDHIFDNTTAAQDLQNARDEYEAAVVLVESRKQELAKAKTEQEAKATQAMMEEQARRDALSTDDSGGGDGRTPISASGVTAAAKKVIGKYQGVSNMCAMSVRAYLKAAGHPKWDTIATKTGNLDPDGTAYVGPTFAASFAGTDLGQHIMDKSKLKPGDILLYRDTVPGFTPGAVTHVGVMGENGMQYDHNSRKGFHQRSLAGVLTWAKWGGGIRLKGMPSQDPPAAQEITKVAPSSDLNNRKTELISRSESESTTQLQNESGGDPKVILQPIIKPAVVTASSGGGGATLVPGSVSTSVS